MTNTDVDKNDGTPNLIFCCTNVWGNPCSQTISVTLKDTSALALSFNLLSDHCGFYFLQHKVDNFVHICICAYIRVAFMTNGLRHMVDLVNKSR